MTKQRRTSILSVLMATLVLGLAVGCSQDTGDRVISSTPDQPGDASEEADGEALGSSAGEVEASAETDETTETDEAAETVEESAAESAPPIAPHLGDKPMTQPDLAIGSSQAASVPATAPPRQTCEAQIQAAMNACAEANYDKADDYLNQVHQGLKSNLTQAAQVQLAEAERAWVSFRDQSCEFERSQFENGSIAPLVYYSCLEALTDQRTAELKQTELPELAYAQADQQLNQVYRNLKDRLGPAAQDGLTESQLAWIAYRDANCVFEDLHAKALISETQCLARMTETRTDQLQAALEQRQL